MADAYLKSELKLDRCPHCQVDKPRLVSLARIKTLSYSGSNERHWQPYSCTTCGGVVLAVSATPEGVVTDMYCFGGPDAIAQVAKTPRGDDSS